MAPFFTSDNYFDKVRFVRPIRHSLQTFNTCSLTTAEYNSKGQITLKFGINVGRVMPNIQQRAFIN